MIFTLLITRYRELPVDPPKGDWPEGEWPPVTILVAAWNESAAIVRTLEHIAALSYPVGLKSSLPTTTRQTTRRCWRTVRVLASLPPTDASSRKGRESTTP